MLEKPALPDSHLLACVQTEYNLRPTQVTFLPLGVDVHSAAFRIDMPDGRANFLKLRHGAFDELSVDLPHLLKEQGVAAVIAPLETRAGQLWAVLDEYTLILYPFVEGRDAYEAQLTGQQWIDLGADLKKVHEASLTQALLVRIRREDYSPRWREDLRGLQSQVESGAFDDPLSADLAAFMRGKREVIEHIGTRASQLAVDLHARDLEFVLCHGDLHPGNLFLSDQGDLYIVDWDDAILAPKEHDLMLLGAGMGCDGSRQADLFYQGYGPAQVDHRALAYYRYERIVLDLVAFGEQVFSNSGEGEDRAQAVGYFKGQFAAGNVVEAAINSDEDQY